MLENVSPSGNELSGSTGRLQIPGESIWKLTQQIRDFNKRHRHGNCRKIPPSTFQDFP